MNNFLSVKNHFPTKVLWSLVAAAICLYPLVDLIRKLSGISAVFSLVIDLLILTIYFILFLWVIISTTGKLTISRNLLFIYLYLLSIIFCSSITIIYNYESLGLNNLIGLRTYFFFLPMIYLGYILSFSFNDELFLIRTHKLLALLFYSTASIALLQYFLEFIGVSFLPPLEHNHHSFYDYEISMISSVFVSAKKFAKFLLIVGILLWTVKESLNKNTFLMLAVMLTVTYISASREATILNIIFAFYIFFQSDFLTSKRKRLHLSKGLKKSLILLVILLVMALLLRFTVGANYVFATDNPADILFRILAFFPFLYLEFFTLDIFLGSGPGSYGQELLLAGLAQGETTIFSAINIGGAITAVFDSGLTKVILDLGIFGLLPFFLLGTFIVVIIIPELLKSQKNNFLIGFGFIVGFIIIFFLKSHPVMVDNFSMSLFYFSIGAFVYHKDRLYEKN